jgi:hypothetical protein
MVILRGWAEAPLSPRLQGQRLGAQSRPIARATTLTLKAKSPRALLWTVVSTSLARTRAVYRPPHKFEHFSRLGCGTPVSCSYHSHWDTQYLFQPSSQVPEFGALPKGMKKVGLASSQQGQAAN